MKALSHTLAASLSLGSTLSLWLWATVLPGCPASAPSADSGQDVQGDSTPDGPGPCPSPYLGDRSSPIDMKVTARAVDGTSRVIESGAEVSIILPPQGGRVVFLGVRAKNIDPCAVRLAGIVREKSTGQIRVDARTVNLAPDGSGFVGSIDSDISSFSNVPLCPNQWADQDIFDREFEAEIELTDRTGKKQKSTLQVTLRCNEADAAAECRCICKKGYKLGETCQ